jgi:Family of unknown function (DUF6069)
VYTLLARWRRVRWWPFIGSTALAISINGPSYLADGISTVALICLHFVVAVVLIMGFMRFVPRPYPRPRPGRRPPPVPWLTADMVPEGVGPGDRPRHRLRGRPRPAPFSRCWILGAWIFR